MFDTMVACVILLLSCKYLNNDGKLCKKEHSSCVTSSDGSQWYHMTFVHQTLTTQVFTINCRYELNGNATKTHNNNAGINFRKVHFQLTTMSVLQIIDQNKSVLKTCMQHNSTLYSNHSPTVIKSNISVQGDHFPVIMELPVFSCQQMAWQQIVCFNSTHWSAANHYKQTETWKGIL